MMVMVLMAMVKATMILEMAMAMVVIATMALLMAVKAMVMATMAIVMVISISLPGLPFECVCECHHSRICRRDTRRQNDIRCVPRAQIH